MRSLHPFVLASNLSVLAVTETWLTEQIQDNELIPSGYTIFRKDRKSRGGGVLIAVKHTLAASLLHTPKDLEVVSINLAVCTPLTIALVYMPPNAPEEYRNKLYCYLRSLTAREHLLILGDFNLPDINWSTLSGTSDRSEKFCDVVYDCGLSQLVCVPTHKLGNILDLVLTNQPSIITNVEVCSDPLPLASDHFPIFLDITNNTLKKCIPSTREVYNYRKTDIRGLVDYLMDLDLSFSYCLADVESLWLSLRSIISRSVNLFTPKVLLRSHPNPKWFTSEIRHELHIVHSLRKKAKSHPTDSSVKKLKDAEAKLNLLMQNARSTFEFKLAEQFSGDKSKVYKYLRELSDISSLPPIMFFEDRMASNNYDKANLFNEYFYSVFTESNCVLPPIEVLTTPANSLSDIAITEEEVYTALVSLDPTKAMGLDEISPRILRSCALPLTPVLHHLFSMCLLHHNLPLEWKVHKIVPVFKNKDKARVNNYRPISLLSSVSKVFERLVFDKIKDFIWKTITPKQFGFLPGHSTIQQMLLL